MRGEVLRGLPADVRNSDGVDEPPQLAPFRRIERGEQVVGGFFREAFYPEELFARERPEVGRGLYQFPGDKLGDDRRTEVPDVQAGLRGEVRDAPDPLTFGLAGEFPERLSGLAHGLESQFLQARGEIERRGFLRALSRDDTHDARDDLAGLFDDDGVALADVLARDLVLVVQRGAFDGGTGEGHGFELGDRGHGAGASDLERDRAQARGRAVRREFAGDRPVREFARRAGKPACAAIRSSFTTAPSVGKGRS